MERTPRKGMPVLSCATLKPRRLRLANQAPELENRSNTETDRSYTFTVLNWHLKVLGKLHVGTPGQKGTNNHFPTFNHFSHT